MKNTHVQFVVRQLLSPAADKCFAKRDTHPRCMKIIERFDLRRNRRTYVEYNKDAITSFAVDALLTTANPISIYTKIIRRANRSVYALFPLLPY